MKTGTAHFIVNTILILLLINMKLLSQVTTMEISKNWKFHQADKTEWYPVVVPGCVHTDLFNNKVIEDPFFRINEKNLQWIDKVDWEYETTFLIDETIIKKENAELQFKGLDTYADVYLNDKKIISTDNMFREWNVDCKSFLKKGENILRIYFFSPVKVDLPKLEKLGYSLPAINDQSKLGGLGDKCLSVFARKAPYHYGWDWGPRFVTSGIWRPIVLKTWDNHIIRDIQFIQNSLSEKLAALSANVEISSNLDDNVLLNIRCNDKELISKKIHLVEGQNKISASFEIENPKYWWPNGLGGHDLYNFTVSLKKDGTVIDKKIKAYGLRTIEVVQDADSIGRGFYFKVNGKPVFMKGSNYIPSDMFLNRVKPTDYEAIVKSAADANMNMLRIWGGGIYENDIFYDLCDKYGILIWQDFMFACSMYPGDEHFLANVRQEAIDNVKRLRNHPSIALWCGNNEIEDAWERWGWKIRYTIDQQKEIYNTYKELFLNIIPSIVREYDGSRFYWPSSPSSDFGRASTVESGDMHTWGVWHSKDTFDKYADKIGRFVSEYGFQSLPEFNTVKTYTIPEDWDIESPVMVSHQRSGYGNLRIRDYLDMYYKTPKDFQSFLYASQVLQAYGIKQGIEAHRRAMPYCMGSLYWQINDCWPVASWSSMDYYKRWKALQYIAKKSFEPIIVSMFHRNDEVEFYIVSDKFTSNKADLLINAIDFNGNEIYKKSLPVIIKANGCSLCLKLDKKELIGNNDERSIIINCKLVSEDEIIAEDNLYLVPPKDLTLEKPEVRIGVAKSDEGYSIELSSEKLAKDVYISIDEEGFFSDNYFDILPKTTKKIELRTNKIINDISNKLKLISLIDSY